MGGTDVAKLLIEHGPTALMAIGVGLLVVYIKKWWLGVVFLAVGGLWFTYQAWEARLTTIEVTQSYERSRDNLKTDIGYDDKTVLYFQVPSFQKGQATKLVYEGLRGPFNFVYPCPDGGKCRDMHKYYREVKHRPERYIQEDRPTPYFGNCEASWEALSNGDDSVLRFTITYKRKFIDGDAEYEAWKKSYPVAYMLVNAFTTVAQPCAQ